MCFQPVRQKARSPSSASDYGSNLGFPAFRRPFPFTPNLVGVVLSSVSSSGFTFQLALLIIIV